MEWETDDIDFIRYQEEILSTIRHELGNSVNALKVTLDVLHENYDQFDDEKRKVYVNRGLNLLTRQQDMVEAMKSYAVPPVSPLEEIDFISFWEHFKKIAEAGLKGRNINLICTQDIGNCKVRGYSPALEQALNHLLDNAVEAVMGAPDPEVALTVSRNETTLVIVVRDYGPGISEEDMRRVFIPLYTTKPGKRGMGLPVARRLLAEMGGRLDVETGKGGGILARVRLNIN